ncbi:hypothetical protein BJ878DRAFT_176815 [Calycina marina]|uniref:LysM domain-containing protein n=1 Tax=Calycina marina TaxID=1763456 RepID=A0A9P7YZ03_9HELO|nr:hypothetical protein BJ878DRAFT_176815 [Calycina marina]
MIMEEACCTCALLLRNIQPIYSEKSEKPIAYDRKLACCNRTICGNCIAKNESFATYCPFCQMSTMPSSLAQGLREPPSYTPPTASSLKPPAYTDAPLSNALPPYSSLPPQAQILAEKLEPLAQDVLHFLDHETDTLTSLSFRYDVPMAALRRKNNLSADYLLGARRTALIPGEFYRGGVSLSPRPVEGEEEERRKATVRRWMVACKVSDYDIALLYLEQADYGFDAALEAYRDDSRWEKEHPMVANIKGKGKTSKEIGRRFTEQR